MTTVISQNNIGIEAESYKFIAPGTNLSGTMIYDSSGFLFNQNGVWRSLGYQWKESLDGVYSTEKVGLGLVNPSSTIDMIGDLTFRGTSRIDFKPLNSSTSFGALTFNGTDMYLGATRSNAELFLQANDQLNFRTYNNGSYGIRMILNNEGNLGINSSDPSEKLEVNGGLKIGIASMESDGTIQYANDKFQFRENGTWKELGNASNDVQILGLSGNELSLSNGGGSVTIPTLDGGSVWDQIGSNISYEYVDISSSSNNDNLEFSTLTLKSKTPGVGFFPDTYKNTIVLNGETGTFHLSEIGNSTSAGSLSLGHIIPNDTAEAGDLFLSGDISLGSSYAVPMLVIDHNSQGLDNYSTISLNDKNGTNRINIKVSNSSENGELPVDRSASVKVNHVNGNQRATIGASNNSFFGDQGGFLNLYNRDSESVVELITNSGTGDKNEAGEFRLYDNGNDLTVAIKSENGNDEGVIEIYDGIDDSLTIRLDGYDGDHGGQIVLFGESESGSYDERIIMRANENFDNGATSDYDGAYIVLKNAAGDDAIILESDHGSDSRVITDELEIRGGSDFAENFDILPSEVEAKPGMIVSIDPNSTGKLIITSESYDKRVAGIISGANGVETGLFMGQKGSIADGEYPIALSGRVYVYANEEGGEITPGDLLTTSSIAGQAMRVTDYTKAQGAIIGKAMTSIDEDGFVLVLVNLQ